MALIWACATESMYVSRRKSIKISLLLHAEQKQAIKKALLDSGATECFIHPKVAEQLHLKKVKLPKPRKVKNVDGCYVCTFFLIVFHHHSKRAVLCIAMPYMIQSLLCVTNGRYCVTSMVQGPYSLLRLHGHLGLTYTNCCVVRGHSDLAILHPYCLRVWINYNGVQATAQQRYGCQLPCTHHLIVLCKAIVLGR
jgi:hypothetical protein